MTTAEIKKYIDGMDKYIKKITEEPKEKSLDFMVNSGIMDKNGNLMPEYKDKP